MATAATAPPAPLQPRQLLGEDGRGYELARRLDACGAWRAWLGDSAYAGFVHSLASPAAWENFMRSDDAAGKTRAQILLQLRARALLFDKASISLFVSPSTGGASRNSASARLPSAPAASSLSNINPTYLQLHADDVYFSLEDGAQDVVQRRDGAAAPPSRPPQAMGQPRAAPSSYYDRKPSSESRYSDAENEHMAQRAKLDELPETWYSQCTDKFKKGKPWRFPLGEREPGKRTPDGMSAYIKHLEAHKRKRRVVLEETHAGIAGPSRENGSRMQNVPQDVGSSVDDDTCLLPEMMFPSNCVPDSALPPPSTQEKNQKVDVYGVLDSLPTLICQSPAVMERFGIRPEYMKVEFAKSKYRGKYGPEGIKKLSPEQASQMTQKVIGRVLASVGLEGGTEVSMEVLSKFMAAHVCKLGRILKLLSDSYRQQYSSAELLKMFARTAGISFAALADHMRDTTKVVSLQNQQHARAVQAHPNHLHQQQVQANQIQRPIHTQLNAPYSQNFAFQQQQMQQQQQLQQLRRRQASTPRGSGMSLGSALPMVEVKMENVMESAADGAAFNSLSKQPQYRPQQMAAAGHHVQSGHQFKQMGAVQAALPRLQSQNSFSTRTAPVKVEGFEELMGGEATAKHDAEEHRLTSPSK